MHPQPHPHGLSHDLQHLLRSTRGRREALRWLGAGALAATPLLGCGGGGDATDSSSSSSGTSTGTSTDTGTGTSTGSGSVTTTPTTCSVIPNETAGPYPGDGTNSNGSGIANALTLSGIVRSDIRASVGSSTNTAPGVPLTVTLQLVNTATNCGSLAGYAIYLWHCTRDGLYSMYSSGVTGENFLRGVQVTDSSGKVTFTTIFPGCYSGRMPHIHFEVFASLSAATTTPSGDQIRTSQLALPVAVCNEVYATSGYSASVTNLAQISFASDNVFSDGTSLQLASVTGSNGAGYVASLTVGVSV